MRFHMDESKGFFEENYQHTAWNTVVIELIFVHIGFLGKYEGRMVEA